MGQANLRFFIIPRKWLHVCAALSKKCKNRTYMVLVLKKGASKKEITAITKKIAKLCRKKGVDAYKHCGVIKLQEDALDMQKR